METNICTVCSRTDFRYDEEQCREICNICNTMQDISGICVTDYSNNTNVNFQKLTKYNLQTTPKLTIKKKREGILKETSPWELHQLFKWIFEKQVASMKPFLENWDDFNNFSQKMWDKYIESTGVNFDIFKESKDNIKMKACPIGWGSSYDPKDGSNLLTKASMDFLKLRREQKESESDDIDYEKQETNAKKIRIERMVHMKRLDKKHVEARRLETGDKDQIKKEERTLKDEANGSNEHCTFSDTSTEPESPLSDEDDPSMVQLDFMDEDEKEKVRILRKKKPGEVMWTGAGRTKDHWFMEANIGLLFFTLYFWKHKPAKCCCLMDILRLVDKEIVPYVKIRGFLPNDLFFINDASYHQYVMRDHAPTWRAMVDTIRRLFKYLRPPYLLKFDLGSLTHRMVEDLNLPKSLCNLIDYLRSITEHKYDNIIGSMPNSRLIRTNCKLIKNKYPFTLLPEPFCMAHIFVALRILLRLDGAYETRISDLVLKLEQTKAIARNSWFVWTEWWRDMYKAPSFSNTTSWDDFESVSNSESFFEHRNMSNDFDKYRHLGMTWNEDINHLGRYANPKVPSSLQSVLDRNEKPLRVVLEGCKQMKPALPSPKNYTDTDIRYLLEPQEIKNLLRFPEGSISDDDDEKQELATNIAKELASLVSQHDLVLSKISFTDVTFREDVFHKKFGSNTSSIEDDLIRILTYKSGFGAPDLLRNVRLLESYLFPQKPKKCKKRKSRFV